MTRTHRDKLDAEGFLLTGYDYHLQVWVQAGEVLPCHHPLKMRVDTWCCESNRLAGLQIKTIPGAEHIHSSERNNPRFYPF